MTHQTLMAVLGLPRLRPPRRAPTRLVPAALAQMMPLGVALVEMPPGGGVALRGPAQCGSALLLALARALVRPEELPPRRPHALQQPPPLLLVLLEPKPPARRVAAAALGVVALREEPVRQMRQTDEADR